MKIIFNEEKKLPLTYKYMEVFRETNLKASKQITNHLKSSKIQSDFHIQSHPFKKLVRIL